MITRNKELLLSDGLPPADMLRSVIREHARDLPRLCKLREYYAGRHDILRRERRAGLPNSRVPHGFAAYISDMAAGYLIGAPVRYESTEALTALQNALLLCDAPSVDAELAMQQSVYGKGVELTWVDRDGLPRCTALDPKEAFVVYSDDVSAEPLFGVRLYWEKDARGCRAARRAQVYTANEVALYRAPAAGDFRKPISTRAHYLGQVPMTEYWNNAIEQGDFERVLPLIDAYDVLQSDRVNDRQQFADALLVLTGVVGIGAAEDGDPRSPGERLRQEKTLSLPDSGARVEWLTKEAHEGDADVLRAALEKDIHKFSLIPDLSDMSFAANASGVAMRYKLLGLQQLTAVKERYFREGLRQRLRLFIRCLTLGGCELPCAEQVRCVFTRSLPANETEEAQVVRDLHGIVPDHLLLPRLSFLKELPEKELKDLE